MNSTSIGPLAILYPGLFNFFVISLKLSLSKKNSLVKFVWLLMVSGKPFPKKVVKFIHDMNVISSRDSRPHHLLKPS